MATFGNACISRTVANSNAQTVIDLNNSANKSGTLTQVCIYVHINAGTMTGKVKVFRDDGTNYIFVGESGSQTLVEGSNTISGLSISILAGDFIGCYVTVPDGGVYEDLVGSAVYKNGDIIATSAKNTWLSASYTTSLLATYTVMTDVYINSTTGNDANVGDSCVAGHPVLTFAKAYSLLASGGTIYICNDGADFSGETITFTTPYNIAQGTAGVSNCKLPRFN